MDAEPARKRLRRNKRSCYQCRKRKVKCQLTNEDVEICAECVKSGSPCTLQVPGLEPSDAIPLTNTEKQEHEARLERIEHLLQKLVEAQQLERPQAEEKSDCSEATLPRPVWKDNALHAVNIESHRPNLDINRLHNPTPGYALGYSREDALLALLPSKDDADSLVANTTAWLWGVENPLGNIMRSDNELILHNTSPAAEGDTMHVAKSLLLLVLYMQQLPANCSSQPLPSQSAEKNIGSIIKRVRSFVLSNEDEACSLDGLECLVLLSLIQLNEGAIRKAWITQRRALDIARLHGLQHSFSETRRTSSCSQEALQRRLWLSIVCGDCYCSLLLGLEPGAGVSPFGPDDNWIDPVADEDANVQRRICPITARIAQRNALNLHKDLRILQEIDEKLTEVRTSLPNSWWRASPSNQNRSLRSANNHEHLICQMWFYQAQIFAHFPIAFDNGMEDSLGSLNKCIEAARMTLHRYLSFQRKSDQLSRCRAIDQSACIAAIVILLAKIQLNYRKGNSYDLRFDSDRDLVEQVADSFEAVGEARSTEYAARQMTAILSTILDMFVTISDEDALENEPNTPLTSKRSFTADFEVVSGLNKPEMEDIILSSIMPALERNSPAFRLMNRVFLKQSKPKIVYSTEEKADDSLGYTLDDFIDPALLQ